LHEMVEGLWEWGGAVVFFLEIFHMLHGYGL
jgi:hypothetical protein